MRFVCKFAAGRSGHRVSASWRVFSGKKKPDLYLGVEGALSQIKATVHCPRPGWDGERLMKFNHEARGEVAVKLWEAGALPRVHWRGAQVCEGVSLEWRVLFFGEHLKTEGVAVPDDVTLIMPPEPGNAVEVLVSLGLPDKPIPRLSYCIELDSGRLCDGRGVAVAWQSWPVKRSAAVMTSSNPVGRGYVAEAALRSTPPEELRAVGIGEQSDGSLALFDLRATTPKERE